MTGRRVFAGLIAAHLIVKIALFKQAAHAPLIGDEAAYVDGARALSNLVRDLVAFGPVDGAELQRNVVASGWFMPGMSILLTPLFVVDPDASLTMIRGYLGVVTSVLFLWLVFFVRRRLGNVYAGVLLVFPGLVPMWLLFSFGAWGDLCAGMAILAFLTQLICVLRRMTLGQAPSRRESLTLGLLAILSVYFRSSTMLLVVGMGVVLAIAVAVLLKGRQRRRAALAVAGTFAVFILLLLPWSLFASHTLGDRVITTTSVSTVKANTFGDRDRVCFGECDPGSSIWFSPLRYSREVARVTGFSEIEVQRQMSNYARSEVTASSYAADVLQNLGRYAARPAGFASYLKPPDGGTATKSVVVSATNLMFFPMLAVTAGAMFLVVRRRTDWQVISVIFTFGFGALLTQPFVHIAGSRYWTTAAPLFALALGLLIHVLLRRPTVAEWGSTPSLQSWLTRIQAAATAVTIAIIIGVVSYAL